MTDTRIDFDTTEVDAFLREVAARLTDMTPVMDEIGETLVASTKQRFQDGVAPDGTPWAPNTPATLARKRGTRPLIGDTGALSQNIFAETAPDRVSWGSALIYAAVHQMGAGQGVFGETSTGQPIPFGPIPARPFIGVSEEDTQAIVLALEGMLDPD